MTYAAGKKADLNDRRKVGARLKEIRRKNGLTQGAFSKLIGCSVRALRDYEKGIRSFPRIFHRRVVELFAEDPFYGPINSAKRPVNRVIVNQTQGGEIKSRFENIQTGLDSIRDRYEKYLSETCTNAYRKWIRFRENTFLTATIAFLSYFLMMDAEIKSSTTYLGLDWAFLLLLGFLIIFLPLQIAGLVRFFSWNRSLMS